jgi:hypothetical protein
MNFIKSHLVSRIKIMYKKNENLGDSNFLYLDKPIDVDGKRKVNRLNQWYPFCEEELVHSGWHDLSGNILKEIYISMRDGKFYGYKTIEGRKYKLRRRCSKT